MKAYCILLCVFSLSVVIHACNPETGNRESPGEVAQEQPQRPSHTDHPLNYYLLDKYAVDPFEIGSPTLANIRSAYGEDIVTKSHPIRELRSSILADSLVTVHLGEGKLVYYVGNGTEVLYYAQLADNKLRFRNGIRIGMTKPEFASKFDNLRNEEKLPAVIQIANPNNREVYNFIFYQDTLGMVIYDSYIE